MTANEIRIAFLDFFNAKQHQIVKSAPMVLKNDPSLMFTNAGMNQFKDFFLGNEESKYKRITDAQKCLRVSGKHNDLEEVGIDTYHHTMFEMLGNWSIGDYFKKEAIEWAWELLVDVLKLDKNRLYVTYFGGDKSDALDVDTEAMNLWKSLLDENRILPGSKKDNFWEMGESGPCGPCSEIHVDMRSDEERSKIDGAELVNMDHPQVIEIWNLVFIQFKRLVSGKLELLPRRHIDTGMGFERLVRVIQQKQSNYDTDVFMPLINKIEALSSKKYGENEKIDISIRVIADHVRAVAFAIADGQLPSNVKAGYVIRRILRRAIRYGYSFLNFRMPFICELLPVLVKQMGVQFPELKKQENLIVKVIREEENSFLRTLENGILRFDQYVNSDKCQNKVQGQFAFELYDTFGFPIDLTQLLAREKNLEVDIKEFTKYLEKQKARSRKDAIVSTGDWIDLIPEMNTEFTGYDSITEDIKIIKYRKTEYKGKERYQLVFDKTPFYAESGGQVGDTGIISNEKEEIQILNTIKELNLSIHITDKLPSEPKLLFHAKVNESRISSMRNHSATHLLHSALRKVLGSHVEQKGSFVHPDYLRFDFAHFQKLSEEEVLKVEQEVNLHIRQNIALDEYRNKNYDEALKMGALALFGEKYGDKVRVIKYGDSVELCGGTHVAATGMIGFFKIISETAIAAGVRRIEAISGEKAEHYIQNISTQFSDLKQIFKGKDVLSSVENILEKNTALQKEIDQFRKDQLKNIAPKLLEEAKELNNVLFVSKVLDVPAADLKDIAFALRALSDKLVALLVSIQGEKVGLTLFISDKLLKEKSWNAGQMIREIAKAINGGGGGQPFLASAGGTNKNGVEEAVEICKKLIGA